MGPPKAPKNGKSARKDPSKIKLKKRMKKDTPNEKEIVEGSDQGSDQGSPQRNPPPPPPYPGRATPAHPQSRVSAKALEALQKLFTMVCSTPFVLARRIGGFMAVGF